MPQLEIYQWLVPLVAVLYITRVLIQYRNKKRYATSTFFWIIFWVAVSALAIVPHGISMKVAEVLGIKSNINAVIFVALGFLFFIVFYLSAALERMERQMTDLVRQVALEKQFREEELNAHKKIFEKDEEVHVR